MLKYGIFGLVYVTGLVTAEYDRSVHLSTFYSRPDLQAPVLNVTIHRDGTSPGYVFMAPSFSAPFYPDSGPYIFDNEGSLVWSGVDDCVGAGATDIQGLHVCPYNGTDHLCYWQGRQREIHGRGVGVIMNKHYQVVKTIQSSDPLSAIDLHEFHLTTDESALVTNYRPRFYEYTWILDSQFQELDLDGNVLFEWSALDHVDTSESYVAKGSYREVGDGSRSSQAWDFFHINSVDKNAAGDYLVSSRHTNCIYKISGSTGAILWRLNGGRSSFDAEGSLFRRQHHARFIEDTGNYTLISLFNNDGDHYTVEGDASYGMLVEIDHNSRHAREVSRFDDTIHGQRFSESMGSVIVLPNRHMLVNWGAGAAVGEFGQNGSLCWYVHLGLRARNYRAHKSYWVGEPLTTPAIWTHFEESSSSQSTYASWNGATGVHHWHLYASENEEGPYFFLDSATKTGFETALTYGRFYPWTFVEAVGVEGSLGNSSVMKTIVLQNASTTIDTDLQCDDSTCLPHEFPHQAQKDPEISAPAGFEDGLPSCQLTAPLHSYVEHVMAIIGALACLFVAFQNPFVRSWRKANTTDPLFYEYPS